MHVIVLSTSLPQFPELFSSFYVLPLFPVAAVSTRCVSHCLSLGPNIHKRQDAFSRCFPASMSAVASQEGLTELLPSNEQCGGDYPLYSFGQTDKEVTVTIPVPPGTRAKSVRVETKAKHLHVEIPSRGVVLDGELYKPVNVDESTWCMQDGKELVIVLTKTNMQYEEWWPLVILGERQIDMKTLKPPSMRFSELDEGAQATVAKMMHEQRQQRDSGAFSSA